MLQLFPQVTEVRGETISHKSKISLGEIREIIQGRFPDIFGIPLDNQAAKQNGNSGHWLKAIILIGFWLNFIGSILIWC